MIIILSCISAFLYWAGGHGKPFHTLYRDIGIPLMFLLYMSYHIWNWTLILSALLMWASLTTYHKWLNPFFKKPTTDAYWFNWIAHGLGVSLSILPFIIVTGLWLPFILRTIVLTAVITLWSEIWNMVEIEDSGKGFAIIITLPIIF